MLRHDRAKFCYRKSKCVYVNESLENEQNQEIHLDKQTAAISSLICHSITNTNIQKTFTSFSLYYRIISACVLHWPDGIAFRSTYDYM